MDNYLIERKWYHSVLDFLTILLVIGSLTTFIIGNITYLNHSSRMVEELRDVKAEVIKAREYSAQAEINCRITR